MPEYKEYALQGGQPVRIQPFDAAAAGEGVHFAEEGCAFNPVIVTGGGGNPNYVETIEGTAASPFGNHTVNELTGLIETGAATITLELTDYFVKLSSGIEVSGALCFTFAEPAGADEYSFYVAEYVKGFPSYPVSFFSVTDGEVTTEDADTPTVLTIIHHPLPNSGT